MPGGDLNTHRLEKDKCPWCETILDAASNVEGTNAPKPGDYTICIYCTMFLFFDDNLRLRRATKLEEKELNRDPVARKLKKAAQEVKRSDKGTGQVDMKLLPPHKQACQVCGHIPNHAPEEPHNALSLYYQYSFYFQHGRWPTWVDAMAHCTIDVRERWIAELKRKGLWKDEWLTVQK